MASSSLALMDVLAEITDFRQSQGKRYPLAAVLALAVAAKLCGYQSYSAIAEWGRHYGASLLFALGFASAHSPCATTFHSIFCGLDSDAFEARLSQWAQAVLAALPAPAPEHGATATLEALAIDGKTLRGSSKQEATDVHLLSALSHRLGLTLGQCPVADHTNEIGGIGKLLEGLFLQGKVIIVDALLTQRKVAQRVVEAGGDYVMAVKENQPQLRAVIEGAIAGIAFYREAAAVAETLDSGHGRVEQRRLQATSVLGGQQDLWPGIEQVFCLKRRTTNQKSGKEREEVVYGVTSLSGERAGAEELLKLVRGHWRIENQSHWVRDVTYREDRSAVRKGRLPQVMAAVRNVAIGLLRLNGETNIARACRRLAAQPWQALALMGIHPKTE